MKIRDLIAKLTAFHNEATIRACVHPSPHDAHVYSLEEVTRDETGGALLQVMTYPKTDDRPTLRLVVED